MLRATLACNFSSLIWPAGSAPAVLASLLFDPPEPQTIGFSIFHIVGSLASKLPSTNSFHSSQEWCSILVWACFDLTRERQGRGIVFVSFDFRICEVIDPAFEAFRSNIAEVPCAQVGEAYMGINIKLEMNIIDLED